LFKSIKNFAPMFGNCAHLMSKLNNNWWSGNCSLSNPGNYDINQYTKPIGDYEV